MSARTVSAVPMFSKKVLTAYIALTDEFRHAGLIMTCENNAASTSQSTDQTFYHDL